MGGTAFLIHGEVDEQRQSPPPGVFARLFGQKAKPAAREGGFVDLPCKDLKVLAEDFHEFLGKRIPDPSPSSKAILDYLALVNTNIYLRGERDAEGKRTWYVQLSFGGCAGMAEVSAEVAAHWAACWYASQHERVATELLEPRGFKPSSSEAISDAVAFVPIGSGGYASYPTGEDVPAEYRCFSIDVAAAESDEAEATRAEAWLSSHGATLIQEHGCLCQVCAPELRPTEFPAFAF